MSMVDFIVIGVVAGLVALAIYKIVRDKKRGVKCSGCGGCSGCPDKNLQ
ncbi:FeoB-associated Cys-rich membrane protein [Desulfosporosinus sp.]|nr:FeoB-associated Cys-rich membrane protein [Desulfosporosinus sp.]MBC2728424.1 FeoB-associated Cys-rich membrane protein [Desulfosporosinus sp.]